jgi:hypothetical protein
MQLEEVKRLRKEVIFRGKSQPGYAETKGKELLKKNKHAREKYCNPNNIDESGSIDELDVELLYGLIQKYNPATIIEVGTWFGTSAMVMDMASGQAEIWTCDKHDLCVYESHRVHKYTGMSTGFFDRMIESGIKADFVFLDGRLQGDEGKLLRCTADTFTVFVHDYKKPEKGWKNIRALQKLFPGVAVQQPSRDTALMTIKHGDAK